MQIKTLFENSSLVVKNPNLEITGLFADSRKVEQDSVFVAIPGSSENGEQFVADAVFKGVRVVVAEHPVSVPESVTLYLSKNVREDFAVLAKNFFARADEKMDLFAVTGTNGKTTTATLLQEMLCAAGKKTGLISTVEKKWGNHVEDSVFTTPDAWELHQTFSRMLAEGCRSCVLEASSHGIHQKRLHGLKWECRILTQVRSDHLDYHGTLQAYWQVKTDFLCAGEEWSVVNLNDAVGKKVLFCKKRVRTYALGNETADLFVKSFCFHADGMVFDIHTENETVSVQTPFLIGDFMVENVLAATCAARLSGISWDIIRDVLAHFKAPLGRLTEVKNAVGFRVFVDYAHTADGLLKALEALRPLVKNKLRLVFGCGGNRDKSKRPIMGKIAEDYADVLYLTSDNSRFEKTEHIFKEILSGMKHSERWFRDERRDSAIFQAIEDAQAGDVVLVAGKGHELHQEFEGVKYPFSDCEEVKKALEKQG
jgi:UDP-N-acetylmuramoyl-L-alanyl-D-glutamate--2,6-diaminopimelate ligase